MKRYEIKLPDSPAIGPYSTALLIELGNNAGYVLELSGQVGRIDPATRTVVGDVWQQTMDTIDKVKVVLSEVEWDLSAVTKSRVFLTNMDDYKAMNEAYGAKFGNPYPTRTAIGVNRLPLFALVEIECTAMGSDISDKAKKKYGIE